MIRRLIILIALCAVTPSSAMAVAPGHATGCTSYKFSTNQARGYCTHLDGTAQARERATCKNLSTGQLANAYGALVQDPYVESKAVCGPNWVVAAHQLIVYQS